jgi:hypothetical protein
VTQAGGGHIPIFTLRAYTLPIVCFATLTGLVDDKATPPLPDAARRAIVLFVIIVMLLGAFLLGVALVTIVHRLRARRPLNTPATSAPGSEPAPDPWQESARRIPPDDA